MARIHAAIAERAGQQLGLLRQQDLEALGVTDHGLRTCIRSGLLIREGRGVLRHIGFPQTHRQQLLIAAWVAGPGAAISHMAAARLWGFDGLDSTAVELSVPRGRNPTAVPGIVHRVRDLLAVDVDARGLIPVTTPSRTLLDTAPTLDDRQLEEALDGACRRGQVYLPHLRWRVTQLRKRGRPGIAALERLLSGPGRDRSEESWLESAFLRLLRDAGLPSPRIQVHRRVQGDVARFRLDATYGEHHLVVELDGHATHATRRQRQADAERDARLLASGHRVIRFTFEDVAERPGYVAATISAFLDN